MGVVGRGRASRRRPSWWDAAGGERFHRGNDTEAAIFAAVVTSLSSSVAWSSGLPWLADFAPAMVGVEPRGDAASPATAVVVRRLGPRQQLAREAGVAVLRTAWTPPRTGRGSTR